jgi:putative intracellular protease/amidase
MEIAIPLYAGFTALDAIGPYEVLSRLPGANVRFLGHAAGSVTTDNGMLHVYADHRWEDAPAPDVIVVPGGDGTREAIGEPRLLEWLRSAHETSSWTTSVCSGSLILGAAGLLEGLEATSHWAVRDLLSNFGATPVEERVVEQGKIITAAGVSAGIDMALTLAARIAGEDTAKAIQLGIEYDPEPPFDSGTPAKASGPVVDSARAILAT